MFLAQSDAVVVVVIVAAVVFYVLLPLCLPFSLLFLPPSSLSSNMFSYFLFLVFLALQYLSLPISSNLSPFLSPSCISLPFSFLSLSSDIFLFLSLPISLFLSIPISSFLSFLSLFQYFSSPVPFNISLIHFLPFLQYLSISLLISSSINNNIERFNTKMPSLVFIYLSSYIDLI